MGGNRECSSITKVIANYCQWIIADSMSDEKAPDSGKIVRGFLVIWFIQYVVY